MTEGCRHEVSLVDEVPVEMVLDLAESLWEDEPVPQAMPGRAAPDALQRAGQ
jgi:hypothetical protein